MPLGRLFPRLFASVFLLFILKLDVLAQNPRKEPGVYLGPGIVAEPRAQPPSRSLRLSRPGAVALGRLSADERGKLGAVGMKRRIGVHRELPVGTIDQGTWTSLGDGRVIWRLGIGSAEATGLRVEFFGFSVGSGKVWVHSGSAVDGPYTDQGPYGNGEFWSAAVAGESIVIEYEAAAGARTDNAPPFGIRRIAHHAAAGTEPPAPLAFRAAAALPLDVTQPLDDPAASCNRDVNCFPEWQDTRKSVAHIQFEETQGPEKGTFLCSASLVATRDNSFKPYLLTAGHCIHDEAAARSLQTFWAYESNGCNQGPPSSRGTLNSQNGGHLVAWGAIEQGDYSLVLLPNVPSGVVFAGWDTSDPSLGSPLVGIHHPAGSYKRISFGQNDKSVDADVEGDPAPAALYHDVVYTKGITEPGSSGSPLFSAPGVIVGMLTYGPALPGEELCVTGDFGGYGKFSNAYNYLRDYLEDVPFSIVQPSVTSLRFTGSNHVITGATSQAVTLTVQATQAVPFSIRADAPWVQLSQVSGTVSASAPAKFQVSVNPVYFVKSGAYTTTISILSGSAPPQFINVTVNMTIDTSNVAVSAIPNPVPRSGTAWQLTLHAQETNGAATRLIGLKIDGVDYSSNIAGWFGTSRVEANGSIDAVIHTTGLVTPVDKFFEFFGQDVASGQSWYRTLTVTFTQ